MRRAASEAAWWGAWFGERVRFGGWLDLHLTAFAVWLDRALGVREWRRSAPTAVWGWRRGWLAYRVVSTERAQREHLEPVAVAEFSRDRVTVLV